MSGFGHGSVGTREKDFTALLPLRTTSYPIHKLFRLAEQIQAEVDTVKDGADAEENLWVPAGYTYFGQFIDHDLTFDNTSSLNRSDAAQGSRAPSNLRTPRFDLDCLYGDGPDAQPFMYAEDGASLLFKDSYTNQTHTTYDQARQDLLRSPNGRAIIGDKRNDENSIVSQIHLSFVKFHNAVVARLTLQKPNLTGTALFEAARDEVRWAYQKLVIEDFLPRIVNADVLADLQAATTPEMRKSCYVLYEEDPDETKNKRKNLPREFVVAAYRFGHSGVRFGYRLNKETSLSIFPPSKPADGEPPSSDSLLGFDPLPKNHVIDDWRRFFPNTKNLATGLGNGPDEDLEGKAIPNPAVRLQFAYKIDPTLVDPLTVLPSSVLPTSPKTGGPLQEVKDTIAPDRLPDPKERPSLALLNLLRGNSYNVQSGQEVAKVLRTKFTKAVDLTPDQLCVRKVAKKGFSRFVPINSIREPNCDGTANPDGVLVLEELVCDTPLWFYILAEAQAPILQLVGGVNVDFSDDKLKERDIAKTQLGWVGGRIVAEVFYGLMDSDQESYVHKVAKDPSWKPIWANDPDIGNEVVFANLLKFAGQPITPDSN